MKNNSDTALRMPNNLDADPEGKTDRIVSLNDGIYAFAMTLLAINVDLPQLAANATAAQVTDAVLGLVPQFTVYVTSFLLVALFWQVNRRTFRYIEKSDGVITWLNILQLMCVAFLPVATGLFDTYSNVAVVTLLYGGTLTLIGILGQLLWIHARRANLLDAKLHPVAFEYYIFRGSVAILIYVIAMLTVFLSTDYAHRIFILLLLVFPFMQRLFRVWYGLRHKENQK